MTGIGIGVGVDVGGTFTDLVAIAPDGRITVRKVLTTPADQSEAVADALTPFAAGDVDRIVHGTTVATNALLERKGARVVLCATRGFADVIALRRQDRASLYDLSVHHPAPLVPRALVVDVDERITPDGIARALSEAEARRVAGAVQSLAPDIVAICLLHAYEDPSHERALREAIAEALPAVEVVLSSDVFPEIREYERTTTTVAEAYLRPRVSEYLRRLSQRLEASGYAQPAVMTSSGGMTPARNAARSAAQLALSGPAGGVVGAATVLDRLGIDRALTIDIGGTSADVGLILDRRPRVEPGGAIAGIPIALPRVLVETVSAGGGSIAWVDDGGALRVGPRSAGSVPGPVAFGRGGTQPTVTDAHVVLGSIRDTRLSGGVRLDVAAARRAVEDLAARLDAPVDRVARAIIATADASMARALRRVSVERGVDPRDCTLVAFGGGGPLHGCGLAEQIGVTRVLVPPHAGVLSAVGLALSPERREAMASVMRRTDAEGGASLEALARDLSTRLEAPASWRGLTTARVRYAGQGHELDVPVERLDMTALRESFEVTHQSLFGYRLDRPVEIVSLRHSASGAERSIVLERSGASVWDDASPFDSGGALAKTVEGPISIALPDATLYVAEGWTASALPIGGWMLERRVRS
ncbi:MAG TPA: hydantoinase/oxoprolinase family protein [Gemmatimonadaceae bacterium]|nr:hydantoinase/oxoprolinase family protein [Gemmatimonadaceae bacterium]